MPNTNREVKMPKITHNVRSDGDMYSSSCQLGGGGRKKASSEKTERWRKGASKAYSEGFFGLNGMATSWEFGIMHIQ